MPSQRHTHTYVRWKSRPQYYRCKAPDCTHFIDKEFLEGKPSLCALCGKNTTLTKDDLRRVNPRCIECSNSKKARDLRKAKALTKYLGTDTFSDSLANIRDSGDLKFSLDNIFKTLNQEDEEEPEEDE